MKIILASLELLTNNIDTFSIHIPTMFKLLVILFVNKNKDYRKNIKNLLGKYNTLSNPYEI